MHNHSILWIASAALAVMPLAAAAAAPLAQTNVFISGQEGYNTFRIPSLLTTRSGTLLAFIEGRKKGAGDAGDIDLLVKRSADGGRSWSAARVVWDDADNTCGNPCAVVEQKSGRIFLLMTWNLGADREPQIIAQTSKNTRRVFFASSADDGVTWSRPAEITAAVKFTNWTWYATGPGAGIQLERGAARGRLVIPCDHIEAGTKHYYSHVIYSDDAGQSWKLGGRTPQHQVNECEVVELSDGRLMLNMRNYDRNQRTRQIAFSADGGLAWQEQKHVPDLIEPICQATLRRHSWPAAGQPGMILFANPASAERRERMTVRASFDDGQTWPVHRLLDSRPSAYSCLAILPNGDIGLLYEAGEKNPYQTVVFARFSPAWLSDTTTKP